MFLPFEHIEFDWDAGNTEKCQKHGLSIDEIQGLFANDPLVVLDHVHSGVEERLLAMGRGPGGRMIFVGFTIRFRAGKRLVRPLTARYMREKEYFRYAKTSS